MSAADSKRPQRPSSSRVRRRGRLACGAGLLTSIVLALFCVPGWAALPDAAPSNTWVDRCEALASADFTQIKDAPTQVTEARFEQVTELAPAHCHVVGYAASNVGVSLLLPMSWNGKLVQIGCGGYCGEMTLYAPGCYEPLRRGYACLLSDTGHVGTPLEGLWAYHNLQAQVDWGFRAVHIAAIAGKALTTHYYAQELRKSYFLGCSNGGRQALQEAQLFPFDFDGIVAGAPAINIPVIYMTFAWGIRVTHDSAGKTLLGESELKLLTAAAVGKCDLDDGVKDGIIGDPLHCKFDPGLLACKAGQNTPCLSAPQVEAARKVYAGPTDANGMQLSLGGPLPGSEYAQPVAGEQGDWTEAYTGVDGKPALYEQLVTDGLRYLAFSPGPGPGWKLSKFDFDSDYKRMGIAAALVNSTNPDLRQFKAAGGKLIAYQGLNDNAVPPRSTIDYYNTVERTLGGRAPTQEFFRLFMLPAVQHCTGGNGADAADFLGYLDAWVERGQAPDRILTGHLKSPHDNDAYPYRQLPTDTSKLRFTRPVFPYPLRAKYKGTGDPDDAQSFAAVSD